MSAFWNKSRLDNGILILSLGHVDKEVNVLSKDVVIELNEAVDDMTKDPTIKGVVIVSAKKDFILGADIHDIASLKTAEEATLAASQLAGVLQKIADLPYPSVAAIHGQALGGGMELALACTWRIASSDESTKLGLPEIQLGLIPGAGGTQRLPRLIGIQAALDLILTGKRLSGKKAEKLGIVDAVVPVQSLRDIAAQYACKRRSDTRKERDLRPNSIASNLPKWALEGNPLGRHLMAKKAREMIDDKTHGFYPASYKALEAVFDGIDRPLAKGLELEAKLFGELVPTGESKSLIHLFHATTALKKHKYKEAGRKRFGDTPITSIGVIGAGFMGAGITVTAVDKDLRVRLCDPNRDSLGKALKHAHDYFKKKVDRRSLKSFQLGQKMAHISPWENAQGLSQCDVVIEAVFEDISLKQKILQDLENRAGDDYIFATNTSAIPIHKIAANAKKPQQVIGMHFFSPVEKMPLLEVVITEKTADWVIARVVDLGQKLGKQVIVVKDGPGFYTTRALSFYLNEGATMLVEGIPMEAIDKALTDFGFPVGPITLIDEVGIDVGMHVLETMQTAFPERVDPPRGLAPVADSGRLGRKNGKGFYTYENGKKGSPDPAVLELIKAPTGSRPFDSTDIVDRCLLQFINESVRCLEDGVLSTPSDGDVGAVFGLGFPPFLGGPFKYVDQVGAQAVVNRLEKLKATYGPRFAPAKTLLEYASKNLKFFPEEAP